MEAPDTARVSIKAIAAVVLAVVSALVLPLALFIEFAVLFLGSIDQAFKDSGSFIESFLIVVAICAFFLLSLLPALGALWLARSARREIRETPSSARGGGLATAALSLTVVALVIWLLGQLYFASLVAGVW